MGCTRHQRQNNQLARSWLLSRGIIGPFSSYVDLPPTAAGQRLYQALANQTGWSTQVTKKLLTACQVSIDGETPDLLAATRGGERVIIHPCYHARETHRMAHARRLLGKLPVAARPASPKELEEALNGIGLVVEDLEVLLDDWEDDDAADQLGS